MISTRKAAVAGAVAAVVAAGWIAAPVSAATLAPVTRCPVGATCVTWQDTNASTVQQDIELLNHAGDPVFWCNNAGGCWVGNDKFGVTGSNTATMAAYLSTVNGTNGQLVIDGKALNGPDIQFITCLDGAAACPAAVSRSGHRGAEAPITAPRLPATAFAPALAGTGAFARAATASTPVTKCRVGATCVTWQDTNTTGVQQDIELIDRLGSPIFWCNNSGGCWVGNDKLGVTGSSVFNLAAYLSTTNGTNGELVIDGQVLTGPDIQFVNCLNGGGTTAACLAPAAATASRLKAADRDSQIVPAVTATPATPCPVGATCVTWQDTNTTGVQKDIELLDHAGSPIYWCDNSGGCWVRNDKLGVTGSSVFNLAAYLSTINGTNGELVIDGQVLTGPDIQFVNCLNGGGTTAACRTS